MNRRKFLKVTLAGMIGATLPEIESNVSAMLETTNDLTDSEFMVYITTYYNLHVTNSGRFAVITGIGEDDDDSN